MYLKSDVKNGRVYNVSLSYGATQRVSNKGVSVNTYVSYTGIQGVLSGGVASNTTIGSGGIQVVGGNGKVYNTKLYYGGLQGISKGGIDIGARIASWQHVYNGGKTSNSYVNSGGIQYVSGGATATNVTINNGGLQYLYKGTATNTTINKIGWQYIYSGGRANNTTIRGGFQSVYSGLASGAKVYSKGMQYVYYGGKASAATLSGGYQALYHGVAYNTKIQRGGMQYIYSAGRTSNTYVSASGIQLLYSGTAINNYISGNGIQYIYKGGLASNTRIFKNGTAYIYSGAVARNINVAAGGNLIVDRNAIVSGAFMGANARLYTLGAFSLRGSNTFSGARGSSAGAITLQTGASLTLTGGGTQMASVGLSAKGASVTVRSTGNKFKSLTTNGSTKLFLDISAKTASSTAILNISTGKISTGQVSVITASNQRTGSYAIGVRAQKNMAWNIRVGTRTIGKARVNGTSLSKNGLQYSLTANSSGVTKLAITAVKGRMGTAMARSGEIVGTQNCDILYGTAGNDVINGINGRDVVVYGQEAWGKDTIATTGGTMTVMLNGVQASDLKVVKNRTDMIISKKAAPDQSVTVKNWNDATHALVYGGTLGQFSKYANVASPSASLQNAARNEVWKKAGLLA